MGYLASHLESSGRFEYVYDPRPSATGAKYNLLRHAGTTMALTRLVGSRFDDGTLAGVAACAFSYLRPMISFVGPEAAPRAYVVDDGAVKLGGAALTALALAAGLERAELRRDEDVTLLAKLARYVASQQRPDGSFVSKRDPRTEEEIPFESLYYPGEAILALCSAAQITGDASLLAHSVRGAENLVARTVAPDFVDHWLVTALAALDVAAPDPKWRAHVDRIVAPMLDGPEDPVPWRGADTTTAIATGVEALVAALGVYVRSGDRMRAAAAARAALRGLGHCYLRQVDDRHALGKDPRARGGFTQAESTPWIRIDCVQHALAASFEAFRQLRRGGAGRRRAEMSPRSTTYADLMGRESEWSRPTEGSSRLTFAEPWPIVASGERTVVSGKSFGMSWRPDRQTIYRDAESYVHDGPIHTDPSHDLAHLLIAASGSLPWRPAGEDSQIRFAEYNAVFLETLLDEAYNCVVFRSIDAGSILKRCLKHARWFVEEHFIPFPIPAEESYRRFCVYVDAAAVTRLSPHYFAQKKRERCSPVRREDALFEIAFQVGDAPSAEGDQLAFQQLVRDQLSVITEPRLTRATV
jgi:hypothetical protein